MPFIELNKEEFEKAMILFAVHLKSLTEIAAQNKTYLFKGLIHDIYYLYIL
jgi:hypothetical protein